MQASFMDDPLMKLSVVSSSDKMCCCLPRPAVPWPSQSLRRVRACVGRHGVGVLDDDARRVQRPCARRHAPRVGHRREDGSVSRRRLPRPTHQHRGRQRLRRLKGAEPSVFLHFVATGIHGGQKVPSATLVDWYTWCNKSSMVNGCIYSDFAQNFSTNGFIAFSWICIFQYSWGSRTMPLVKKMWAESLDTSITLYIFSIYRGGSRI